jgi:DNA-binding NtrC family response regulator
MPLILSISYNKALLQTRELLLSSEGFEVESVVGVSAAIRACEKRKFDLVIMGHSIPPEDKTTIVRQLRTVCRTRILALHRPYESPLKTADYNLDSGDPQRFLNYVKEITTRQKGPAPSEHEHNA